MTRTSGPGHRPGHRHPAGERHHRPVRAAARHRTGPILARLTAIEERLTAIETKQDGRTTPANPTQELTRRFDHGRPHSQSRPSMKPISSTASRRRSSACSARRRSSPAARAASAGRSPWPWPRPGPTSPSVATPAAAWPRRSATTIRGDGPQGRVLRPQHRRPGRGRDDVRRESRTSARSTSWSTTPASPATGRSRR